MKLSHSQEIQLSKDQIEDSVGSLSEAIDTKFSQSDKENGYYQPNKANIPRPNFALFHAQAAQSLETSKQELTIKDGKLIIKPEQAAVYQGFAGLRGKAAFAVNSGDRKEIISGPAILLSDCRRVAVLTAEAPGQNLITTMQHSLLETEYVKDGADVSEHHSASDVTNAGDIGPAMVVVSSLEARSAHQDLHALAIGSRRGVKTFGQNFSTSGRQDFKIGNKTRRPRAVILPTSQVIMAVGRPDQLDDGASLLNAGLSASELAVGMTLAATTSRQGKVPNLINNLDNMVGA
jgi:hypothetical protein